MSGRRDRFDIDMSYAGVNGSIDGVKGVRAGLVVVPNPDRYGAHDPNVRASAPKHKHTSTTDATFRRAVYGVNHVARSSEVSFGHAVSRAAFLGLQ